MAITQEKLRKSFEASLKDRAEALGEDWSDHDFDRSHEDASVYANTHMQAGWAAWQAAMNESMEVLASNLISQLSLVRGRPVEWHEAIEITAIVTGMDDSEKQRLLALEGC